VEYRISRRRFIALTGGTIAAAGMISPLEKIPAESKKTTIAVAEGTGENTIGSAVDALGGMDKFVQRGSVVALKPNISFPNPPQWGTTTSPWVVKAVAELCLKAGAKRVIVVDNPLGGAPMNNVERSGIGGAVAGIPEVKVMMMNDRRKFSSIEDDSMRELKSVEIARILDKVDLLINLPTAKAHNETGVSLGMKNLMGLIWDRKVFHQAYNLERAIAELSNCIRPGLIIMDVSRALLNNGPMGPGRVADVGKIVAGTDPVAVDSFTLTLAEFNLRRMTPEQVPHIRCAAEMGLGTANLEEMEIVEV